MGHVRPRVGHVSYWCPTRVGVPLVSDTRTHHQLGMSVLHRVSQIRPNYIYKYYFSKNKYHKSNSSLEHMLPAQMVEVSAINMIYNEPSACYWRVHNFFSPRKCCYTLFTQTKKHCSISTSVLVNVSIKQRQTRKWQSTAFLHIWSIGQHGSVSQ